jgi:hypothetical protein
MKTTTAHDLALSITLALRAAFGGDSQVSDKVIGMAVFGHANNASAAWTQEYLVEVIDAAAKITFDKWEECGALLPEIRESICEGYRAARLPGMGGTHAPIL